MYEVGQRFRHPKKPNWGVGQVLHSSGNQVCLYFIGAGRRKIHVDRIPLDSTDGYSSRALDAMNGCDWATAKHNLYAIRLRDEVRRVFKFRNANPLMKEDLPCLYVGLTGLAPEERFKNHINGVKSSWFPREFGVSLYEPAYERRNPVPYSVGKELEGELAEHLRSLGYGVWWN